MNICAVRTVHQTVAEQARPTLDNFLWLPHEAQSARRFYLDDEGMQEQAAICKHCGAVYVEEVG